MKRQIVSWAVGCTLLLLTCGTLHAQLSMKPATTDVNRRMVKLFGIGGFKGLPSYGTGVLASSKGHILTVNNHILNTPGLIVHLYDGRQYQAKVLIREPELDVALLQIDEDIELLHFYDFEKEATRPAAETGDWILAFSNQFKIALRDEPMSVQRGVIAATADFKARRGVFEADFVGEVYYLDAIACNPGAAGGALTTRSGRLLGILGRELKDTRTDTWINYAVGIKTFVDVERLDETTKEKSLTKESISTFVTKAIRKEYKESTKRAKIDKGGYHGIVLVVNAVTSTPPYIEEVMPGSPASKKGLQPDDLILYVNGESVPTIRVFRETLKLYGPNDEIRLQIQRGNKLENVKLKLVNQPKTPAS